MNPDEDKISEKNEESIQEENPHKECELIVNSEKKDKKSEGFHVIENVNSNDDVNSESKDFEVCILQYKF